MMGAAKKVNQCSPERVNAKTAWQLCEVSGKKSSNKLLSVLNGFEETPNNGFAGGRKSFSGAAPSILRFPQRETRTLYGPLKPVAVKT
jgi:hypothetical protein